MTAQDLKIKKYKVLVNFIEVMETEVESTSKEEVEKEVYKMINNMGSDCFTSAEKFEETIRSIEEIKE